ncbi:hypothetical protein ACFKFN_004498 [Salmonella enterica]
MNTLTNWRRASSMVIIRCGIGCAFMAGNAGFTGVAGAASFA